MKLTNLGDATDFEVSLNPDTQKIVIHLRNANEAVGLQGSPELIRKLMVALIEALRQLTPTHLTMGRDGESFQGLDIRDISFQMPHPSLPILEYELALGVRLQKALEPDEIRMLRDQLDSVLQALDATPPATKQ